MHCPKFGDGDNTDLFFPLAENLSCTGPFSSYRITHDHNRTSLHGKAPQDRSERSVSFHWQTSCCHGDGRSLLVLPSFLDGGTNNASKVFVSLAWWLFLWSQNDAPLSYRKPTHAGSAAQLQRKFMMCVVDHQNFEAFLRHILPSYKHS